MKLVLTDEAKDDLERIGDYIAKDNPARAITFVKELVGCCRLLVDAPEGFPLVSGHEASGIRRRPYGNYLVFYRVDASRIDILHILHGGRDYERVLFPAP